MTKITIKEFERIKAMIKKYGLAKYKKMSPWSKTTLERIHNARTLSAYQKDCRQWK